MRNRPLCTPTSWRLEEPQPPRQPCIGSWSVAIHCAGVCARLFAVFILDSHALAVTIAVCVSLGNWPQFQFVSPIWVQCFTLTFLAEWGDRSQIATIALAAAKDPYGVTLGGIVGHGLCTALAVAGGRLMATRISGKLSGRSRRFVPCPPAPSSCF